jgi:hypothetical protein
VADTGRSVAFYSRLGLARTVSSLNVGREQEKLDNVLGVVEVTALALPMQSVPHELLCYSGNFDRGELLTIETMWRRRSSRSKWNVTHLMRLLHVTATLRSQGRSRRKAVKYAPYYEIRTVTCSV